MHTLNRVHHMDIFDLCDCLEDDSIDMILCDLPYGITACEWDSVIPFEPMWEAFKRIIKPRGAVVLTASGKFTYKLVMSNFEWFKYEWVWDKMNRYTGYGSVNYRPLLRHEIILIFSKEGHNYYPIIKDGEPYKAKRSGVIPAVYHDGWKPINGVNNGKRQPYSIIDIKADNKKIPHHPTQKPVGLFEYLIRTYTQPGEVVFDPCVGSGTTALAARNTGRNFIVGDSSAEYVNVAIERLAKPYTMPMFEEAIEQKKPEQLGMEW